MANVQGKRNIAREHGGEIGKFHSKILLENLNLDTLMNLTPQQKYT